MTAGEAAKHGIRRLRRPVWAHPEAYLRIDILDGRVGPWFHLYERKTQEVIGEKTPQTFIGLGDTTDDYEPYAGPLDPADQPPA